MSRRPEIITPIEYSEVVSELRLPSIDYERRLTFGRLIAETARSVDVPNDYADETALFKARPEQLQSGLYILPEDPRYGDAELRIGNTVFPSQEFPLVARSPRDLARQTMAKTRRARRGDVDRDETEHAAHRSAGHVLEGRMKDSKALVEKMQSRRQLLASLAYDLTGTWPHYKGKTLESKRVEVDQIIHETAEVAAVNQADLDSIAVQGLHRAIRMHLYRAEESPSRRIARWTGYMQMVARHSRAKQQVAERSMFFAAKEFEKYELYLQDASS